jgi:hypothetical protein
MDEPIKDIPTVIFGIFAFIGNVHPKDVWIRQR